MLLQQASSSPGPSGTASTKLPPSPRPNPSPSFSARLTGSPILSDGASSSYSPNLGANSPRLGASPKYGSPRLGGSPKSGKTAEEDEVALERLQAELKDGWTVHTGRDGRLYYCNDSLSSQKTPATTLDKRATGAKKKPAAKKLALPGKSTATAPQAQKTTKPPTKKPKASKPKRTAA